MNKEIKPRNLDGFNDKRPQHENRTSEFVCATWNIQGLNKKGKLKKIIKILYEQEIAIAVLTETKMRGSGIEDLENYIHIFSGVPKSATAAKGVSIFISKKYSDWLMDWEAVNERIVTADLIIQGHETTIVGVYAPINSKVADEKDKFFFKLDEILLTNSRRELLLMGDMNARTGRMEGNRVVGKYGENIQPNDNGKRTIEFCEKFNLKIMNGFFQHENIQFTWHQDTKEQKSIIDYIIMRNEVSWRVNDVRVDQEIQCGSNHYLLKGLIEIEPKSLSIAYNVPECTSDELRYELHEESTKELYKSRLDELLQDRNPSNSGQELYSHIMESLKIAAWEATFVCCTNLNQQKILQQEAYQHWIEQRDNNRAKEEARKSYVQEHSKLKQIIINHKKKTFIHKFKELISSDSGSRYSKARRFVEDLSYQSNNHKQPISMEEWKAHYKMKLSENKEFIHGQQQNSEKSIKITEDQMEKALHSITIECTSEPEEIPLEFIKNGTNLLKQLLTDLFNKYLKGDNLPQVWKDVWITPLHKRGSENDCNNYEYLSVTGTVRKIYEKILSNLIEDHRRHKNDQQTGFGARSGRDHIFTLTQVIEKNTAAGKDTHLLFIGLREAYDSVPLSKLWEVLQDASIDIALIQAVQRLFEVKINNQLSSSFNITKGLKQGCELSSTLFDIYLETVFQEWRTKNGGMGIKLSESVTLNNLYFADEQVLISDDKDQLIIMTNELISIYEEWELKLNIQNMKYMCIGTQGTHLQLANERIIEYTEIYTYLGIVLTSEGRTEREIEERIKEGKKIVRALNPWWDYISPENKKPVYEMVFKEIVLYGCEPWLLIRNVKRKLTRLKRYFLRQAAGIPESERESGTTIINTDIIDEIRERKRNFYEDVKGMSDLSLPKQILIWKSQERARPGRPKINWLTGVMNKERKKDRRRLRRNGHGASNVDMNNNN